MVVLPFMESILLNHCSGSVVAAEFKTISSEQSVQLPVALGFFFI